MNKLALLFAAMLVATPSRGGLFPVADHLEPDVTATQATIDGDKDAEIEGIVFKEAYGPNVKMRIRIMVLPGGYEAATFVTKDASGYHMVYLYLPHVLSHYWLPGPRDPKTGIVLPNPDPRSATIMRREVSIPSFLAVEIMADWKKLLLQTRYESKHYDGYDGARFVLSMEDETGRYAGQTWNPLDDLPILNALQSVAFDMTMSCGFGPALADQCVVADLPTLEKDVNELTKVLAEHPQ